MSIATSRHSRFPLLFGLSLLAVLLVGFGPSFFFRAWTSRPDLPAYLVVHGLAGTAWFALFIAQLVLASRGQLQWHRQLGMFGLLIAAIFVVTGIQSTLAFTHKLVEQGNFIATNGAGETFVYWAISVSYGGMAVFVCMLAAALYFRRRPQVHGRLMLLATAGLLGPAMARVVGRFVALPNPLLSLTAVFLVALIVRDVRMRGRPHLATVLGGIFQFGSFAAFMLSGFGKWVMTQALR